MNDSAATRAPVIIKHVRNIQRDGSLSRAGTTLACKASTRSVRIILGKIVNLRDSNSKRV